MASGSTSGSAAAQQQHGAQQQHAYTSTQLGVENARTTASDAVLIHTNTVTGHH